MNGSITDRDPYASIHRLESTDAADDHAWQCGTCQHQEQSGKKMRAHWIAKHPHAIPDFVIVATAATATNDRPLLDDPEQHVGDRNLKGQGREHFRLNDEICAMVSDGSPATRFTDARLAVHATLGKLVDANRRIAELETEGHTAYERQNPYPLIAAIRALACTLNLDDRTKDGTLMSGVSLLNEIATRVAELRSAASIATTTPATPTQVTIGAYLFNAAPNIPMATVATVRAYGDGDALRLWQAAILWVRAERSANARADIVNTFERDIMPIDSSEVATAQLGFLRADSARACEAEGIALAELQRIARELEKTERERAAQHAEPSIVVTGAAAVDAGKV